MADENKRDIQGEVPSGFDPKAYPRWGDILSIVGVFFIATVLVKLLIDSFVKSDGGFPGFLSYSISFLVVIAYSLALKYYRTGTLKGTMRYSLRGFDPSIILWGIILMIATSIVIEPALDIFPDKYLEMMKTAMNNGGWSMATAIVAAPLFEEMLFRGIIQEGISRKYGALQGIIVASLIFGVVHIIPQQIVSASVLGMILGYIYYRTQSLFSVIIIHAVNNSLAIFSMILIDDISKGTREIIGSDKIYYMLYGACALLVVISFVRIGMNIRRKDKLKAAADKEKDAADI